jgi:hypothetical protein
LYRYDEVIFEHTKGGKIETRSQVQVLNMGLYEGTSGVLMFLIEIITIVWILYMAWGELREYINVLRSSDGDIVKSLGAHFGDRDVANALEFVSISLQITAFVVWWVYQFQYAFNFSPAKRYEVYYTTAQPQGNFLLPAKNRTLNVRDVGGLGENNTYTTPKKPFKPWELSDDSAGYEGLTEIVDEINTMSDMLVFYGFLQGVNLLLLMARVMKMLKFQPRLAIVTNTVAGAWLDLAHFGGIFMIFLAMMSVMAHIQFGDQVEETSTMLESFIVVFIMLLGGSTGTEFLQPNSVKSVIDEIALGIFYSFMPVFFVLLLLNFLLGILGDSFGDEKEALGEYEGDDLPTDFFKFVKYYSRRVDPRGSRYWPSHWTIRRAVKKAISAHQFNELSDSEKRAVEEEKAFKAAEVMAEKAAEEARGTGYGAAHGVLARALNVSTKALGLNSPLRSPHDRKSPKSPWRPGAMEKGGFDGGERLDDDFDLRSVHSSQANSDDDDASSELSAESEEEEQEQVVIIDGERMTREELIINLNRIHADYVGSIQQTDSAARKRRAVLGYSIEQFVDQLVEFEHEDEMDEDSPEAIQYLQEQAAAVKTERLEALNDQIEGYQESQVGLYMLKNMQLVEESS